jgi:N-dimethylarginine dimethylaminohydrolase
VKGEFDAVPDAVLVHDPVRAGAFEPMRAVNDSAALEREFLYRALPDPGLYQTQHRQFVAELRRHIPRIYYLEELAGAGDCYALTRSNPNHVFTRDSLITIPWVPSGYISARMKPLLRRSERLVMEHAVERLGLRSILQLPEHLTLEGGDFVPFTVDGKRTILAGYGTRTSWEALLFLQEHLIPTFADAIIGIELASWRMNLDGGLLPVAADVVISDTSSILGAVWLDHQGQQVLDIFSWLRDLGMRVIDTTPEESVYAQSCNCVCVGHRTLIYYDLCPRVSDLLRQHDITVHIVSGSELVKGRGGPRCMTRPIYTPPPDDAL